MTRPTDRVLHPKEAPHDTAKLQKVLDGYTDEELYTARCFVWGSASAAFGGLGLLPFLLILL